MNVATCAAITTTSNGAVARSEGDGADIIARITMSIPKSQLQYQLVRQAKGFSLQPREGAPIRPPGPNEALVRVRATSLNRRDIGIQKGFYPVGPRETLVPLSDGAGEVVAVGPGTTRVKLGDRVAATFFQAWIDRASDAEDRAECARRRARRDAGAVRHAGRRGPRPGAGASVVRGRRRPALRGRHGLVGPVHARPHAGRRQRAAAGHRRRVGVRAAAGQSPPARSPGSRARATRSSRARRKLGAVGTINYKTTPEWGKALLELTSGVGAHQTLEVGGAGTLAQSLAAVGQGGHIALIGGLSGFGGDIPGGSLVGRNASVTGITVGSRADFEALNAFLAKHSIRPVIDRVFAFAEADDAYAYMDTGSHFGKIVIRH